MILEYLAGLSAAIVILIMLRNRAYYVFFALLLLTEFYYLPVWGGIARIYHFLSVLVVFSLVKFIPRLFYSRVFIALLGFYGVNIVAIIFSDNPDRAFASSLSLAANIGVAMATTLVLMSGRVKVAAFKRIVLLVTLVSIGWGLIQIIAFRLTGSVLALSTEQESQILMSFGPAFRTEANTFAKYMVFPFLLFLPDYIERRRGVGINIIYLFFLIGSLMNFTRTAIYGTALALGFIIIWYVARGKLALLTGRSVKLGAAIAIGLTLIASGVVSVSEYAQYKVQRVLSRDGTLEDSSATYRMEMMKVVLDDVMSDDKKMIIGNGWGQTRMVHQGIEVQAGGADVVNVLGYSGTAGLAVYLLYMFLAFATVKRAARHSPVDDEARFAEGLMFAFVGIFFASQMAGYIITPEYWMMIGLCIYFDINERKSKRMTPRVGR